MSFENIPSISFVIPCYRSENTLPAVVDELISQVTNLGFDNYEIILVNDCSPDHVWQTILTLSENNPRIHGICLAKNFGQHAALMAGFARTTGSVVVSMDDDGQAPVDELNLLLEKIADGYDVVYAYYEEIKQTPFRRFGTFMAKKMDEFMLDAPKDIRTTSFFAVKRFVVEEMVKYHNPYTYLSGLVLRTTRNIACVKTHHRKRVEGSSGYNFVKLLSLWLNGLTAFSVKPLRVGTVLGTIISIIGFICSIVIVIRKIVNPTLLVGWASTISVILFIGGLLLLMLGLIGEYVGRIYICMNDAPQYVIRETTPSLKPDQSL